MYKTAGVCPTCGRREKLPQRSIQQNRYLWGVVYRMIAEHIGESSEYVHRTVGRAILRRVLEDKEIDIKGEKFLIEASTTDLDLRQMKHYWEELRGWALRVLDVAIPEPNDMAKIEQDGNFYAS